MSTKIFHQPVMLHETIEALQIKPQQVYLDATFGRGGHTQAMLDKEAKVIAFDWDKEAVAWGKQHFAQNIKNQQLILLEANFTQIAEKIEQINVKQPKSKISGILFDFGTTTDQLLSDKRGFSFNHPESNLDMRMDQGKKITAAVLLNLLSRQELTDLFYQFGGEKQARSIAREVVKIRKKKAFAKVGDLLETIKQVKKNYFSHLHPATKVFQALRIAVNRELKNIEEALPQALEILQPTGRIITIAFHGGEDRIAKNFFKDWQQTGLGMCMNKKPFTPSEEEIKNNPRCRSAKLRIFEKN